MKETDHSSGRTDVGEQGAVPRSSPDVYSDTNGWMGYSRKLAKLHTEGSIRLRISRKVLEELEEHLNDPEKAGMAKGALRRIRDLKLEEIYLPRPRVGEGRLGEIRLGDPGRLYDKGLEEDDREVSEYAIAGHVDYAKRGQVRYFLTNDRGILDQRQAIEAEAPGMNVSRIEDFLSTIEEA